MRPKYYKFVCILTSEILRSTFLLIDIFILYTCDNVRMC